MSSFPENSSASIVSDSSSTNAQKPRQLQRILSENGAVSNRGTRQGRHADRKAAVMAAASTSLSASTANIQLDKENINDPKPDSGRSRVTFSQSVPDIADMSTTDFSAGSPEMMSSTLAFPSSTTPERRNRLNSLFSTSNLSSINFAANTSDSPSRSAAKEVHPPKTPNQKGVFQTPVRNNSRDINNSDSKRRSNTPSTGGSGSSNRTPSSRIPHLASSSGSDRSSIRYNPFDTQNSSQFLHLPTLSPSIFATVNSPSAERKDSKNFWNLEEKAILFPAAISEDSPLKQSVMSRSEHDGYDSLTQEKIDLYFSQHHNITSPPDLPPTGPLLQDGSSPNLPRTSSQADDNEEQSSPQRKNNKSTQTMLSLPLVLPPKLEQMLKQFMASDRLGGDGNVLSNSTLRRRLFDGDFGSDDGEADQTGSTSDGGEGKTSPPFYKGITPGRMMLTPVTSKSRRSAQWSSSPLRIRGRHRTSLSPRDVGSPPVSPIQKERLGQNNEVETMESITDRAEVSLEKNNNEEEADRDQEDMVQQSVLVANVSSVSDRDCSDLYHTAESQGEISENMDIDSNSVGGWGLTVNTPEELEMSSSMSRVDGGYSTHHPSGLVSQEYQGQTSTEPELDSGVNSRVLPSEMNSCSVILPPGGNHPPPTQPQQQQEVHEQHQAHQPVMMSYGGDDNSGYISVGFPLGSSTPTRK